MKYLIVSIGYRDFAISVEAINKPFLVALADMKGVEEKYKAGADRNDFIIKEEDITMKYVDAVDVTAPFPPAPTAEETKNDKKETDEDDIPF